MTPRRCPRFGVELCIPATRGDADCSTCEHETRTGPQARAAHAEAMRIWQAEKRGRREAGTGQQREFWSGYSREE